MQRILIGLAVLNTVLLVLASWLGLATEPRAAVEALVSRAEAATALNRAFHRHFLVALIAGVSTLLVHSIVMTYFIGTGRWVKEAVARWALDEQFNRATRRLKAMAFPFAFFSIVLLLATTVLGAACDTGKAPSGLHLAAALVTLGFNLLSYVVEYRAVVRNVSLLHRVAEAASAQQHRQSR